MPAHTTRPPRSSWVAGPLPMTRRALTRYSSGRAAISPSVSKFASSVTWPSMDGRGVQDRAAAPVAEQLAGHASPSMMRQLGQRGGGAHLHQPDGDVVLAAVPRSSYSARPGSAPPQLDGAVRDHLLHPVEELAGRGAHVRAAQHPEAQSRRRFGDGQRDVPSLLPVRRHRVALWQVPLFVVPLGQHVTRDSGARRVLKVPLAHWCGQHTLGFGEIDRAPHGRPPRVVRPARPRRDRRGAAR